MDYNNLFLVLGQNFVIGECFIPGRLQEFLLKLTSFELFGTKDVFCVISQNVGCYVRRASHL